MPFARPSARNVEGDAIFPDVAAGIENAPFTFKKIICRQRLRAAMPASPAKS